jgi:hypothetical protein
VRSLHAGPNTGLGCMDEVTAAAAVLAVSIDNYAGEDLEQDSRPATSTGTVEQMFAVQAMDMDEENEARAPALGDAGAANPKVMNATPLPSSKRCEPPLISPDGHTDLQIFPVAHR